MKEKDSQISDIFTEADIIYKYTRAQAIEDGELWDVSELAKEAGFKFPVAISTGIYSLIDEAVKKGDRDYKGIVWDIFTMLLYAIKRAENTARIDFSVLIWSKYTRKDQLVNMYALCHPGDNKEPVITIMLPHED